MILVGDIGGSNTRLALAVIHDHHVELRQRAQFRNADAASLSALLHDYLASTPTPTSACLAVAGSTDGRSVHLTNLDWHIDADQLASTYGFPCRLINDFEAIAWGLNALDDSGLVTLQPGHPVPTAPRLAIGPGTGLGVAIAPAGSAPLPGEGGHIGFAPVDEEQMALLRFLQQKHGRVSVERLLSGPGIVDLHSFFLSLSGHPVEPVRTAADVTQAAQHNHDPIATQTLRLFCRLLGQTAGDLALAGGTRAGIYLAGGIPPRLLSWLTGPDFLGGLHDKGRFSEWIKQVPVHVVTDPDVGLKGAALGACRT
jgi:glucokinase